MGKLATNVHAQVKNSEGSDYDLTFLQSMLAHMKSVLHFQGKATRVPSCTPGTLRSRLLACSIAHVHVHPEIRETTGDLCTAYRILITCHLPRLKEVNNFLSRKSSSLSISSYLEACWILKFIYVNTGRATQCTTGELSLLIQRDSKLKVCPINKYPSRRRKLNRHCGAVFLRPALTPYYLWQRIVPAGKISKR